MAAPVAQITSLIDNIDNVEVVRDQIAAILVLESENQQNLARTAGKDPQQWKLRVFVERSNPWEEFQDSPDPRLGFDDTIPPPSNDSSPIIAVAFSSDQVDGLASNTVERQKVSATYNIDCYGYGVACDDGSVGHTPGDELAAREAMRACRLVRNILMAGAYTYLGLRGTVWKRWMQSRTLFQPSMDGKALQHVVGVRFALVVDFSEFSPQVEGQTLELISAAVTRETSTGQLLLAADFPISSEPETT